MSELQLLIMLSTIADKCRTFAEFKHQLFLEKARIEEEVFLAESEASRKDPFERNPIGGPSNRGKTDR